MSSRCFKKAETVGLYGNWKRVDDFTKKKKKKKDSIEAIVRSNYSSDAHSRGVPNMIEVEKYTPLNLNIGRTVKDEHLFTREKKREYLIETVANELDVDRVDLIEKIERMRRLIPEIDTYAMTKEKMIEMYRVGSNMRACAKNAIGLKNVVFHESEVSVSEMIARDLRLVYDDDDDDDESGTVEKAETVVKVLMEQDLMSRKDAEKFVYATHRFCANKDRMLVFCEESFVRECVVQNVERLMQVLPNLKAWKIAEKGDAMLRMFFESDANENAVVAANELKKRMPKDCNISLMCSDFPDLLQMDIDRLFFDLSNAFKNQSAEETLRRDPSVSFRVRSFKNSYEDDGFVNDVLV